MTAQPVPHAALPPASAGDREALAPCPQHSAATQTPARCAPLHPFPVPCVPSLCGPGALSRLWFPARLGLLGRRHLGRSRPPRKLLRQGINKPPALPAPGGDESRGGLSSDHETGSERVRAWGLIYFILGNGFRMNC